MRRYYDLPFREIMRDHSIRANYSTLSYIDGTQDLRTWVYTHTVAQPGNIQTSPSTYNHTRRQQAIVAYDGLRMDYNSRAPIGQFHISSDLALRWNVSS